MNADSGEPARDRIYYAHSRKDAMEVEWQRLADHLKNTAEIASEMGRDADISDLAYLAGLLHDLGKYSDQFQGRLRGDRQQVDHSTAGAREVMTLFPKRPQRDFAELISYAIAGHHSGLPDCGSSGDLGESSTLLGRRNRKKLPDYSAYRAEIQVDSARLTPRRIKASQFRFRGESGEEKTTQYAGFSVSFLTRMLFSTLVDADSLETERYCQQGLVPRGGFASLEDLKREFDLHLGAFGNPKREIDKRRTEITLAAISGAQKSPGFFTLTVPTGGGKTLTSMAFALNHALAHGLRRIIYVIPYTSIIEQNARVFREALGVCGHENVLEHHSNLDWEKVRQPGGWEGVGVAKKLKLAAENWDVPIVVTTNVQFFESIFSNRRARARKVHNLAKSVIILDEAQMLPRDYLKPCLMALSELVQNYGASVVLSTATQPNLHRFFPASTTFTELAPETATLFDFFRRVQVRMLGGVTDEALLGRLAEHEQALCIVNTRRHAKSLFDALAKGQSDGVYHLSTLMCPAHRSIVLEEIRSRLNQGEPCRVVSTQVMEAGIDVDFPVGYRALAGLDSILQAAGRVNREMKRGMAEMFVFEPDANHTRPPAYIRQAAEIARQVLREYPDPTTQEAIDAYYTRLYTLQGERAFDARDILGSLDKQNGQTDFDFKQASDKFKMIDEDTVAVLVPFDATARALIEQLRTSDYPAALLRKLQPYAINIYEPEFNALRDIGAVQPVGDTAFVLSGECFEKYYTASGLVLPEKGGGVGIFI